MSRRSDLLAEAFKDRATEREHGQLLVNESTWQRQGSASGRNRNTVHGGYIVDDGMED